MWSEESQQLRVFTETFSSLLSRIEFTEEDSNCGGGGDGRAGQQRKRIVLANFGCDQTRRWCGVFTLLYPSSIQ